MDQHVPRPRRPIEMLARCLEVPVLVRLHRRDARQLHPAFPSAFRVALLAAARVRPANCGRRHGLTPSIQMRALNSGRCTLRRLAPHRASMPRRPRASGYRLMAWTTEPTPSSRKTRRPSAKALAMVSSNECGGQPPLQQPRHRGNRQTAGPSRTCQAPSGKGGTVAGPQIQAGIGRLMPEYETDLLI